MYMYLYICICVRIHICINIYICLYIQIYILWVCIYIHVYEVIPIVKYMHAQGRWLYRNMCVMYVDKDTMYKHTILWIQCINTQFSTSILHYIFIIFIQCIFIQCIFIQCINNSPACGVSSMSFFLWICGVGILHAYNLERAMASESLFKNPAATANTSPPQTHNHTDKQVDTDKHRQTQTQTQTQTQKKDTYNCTYTCTTVFLSGRWLHLRVSYTGGKKERTGHERQTVRAHAREEAQEQGRDVRGDNT